MTAYKEEFVAWAVVKDGEIQYEDTTGHLMLYHTRESAREAAEKGERVVRVSVFAVECGPISERFPFGEVLD